MRENQKIPKTGLLPRYFKKIGIIVMILAFVPLIIVKAMNIEVVQAQKEFFKIMTLNMFILGLLFVVLAKDKIEDEMTIALRVGSMAFAFISAVLFVVLKSFTNLIFKDMIVQESAHGLVIVMLFSYIIFYYLQKKGR